MPTTPFPAYPPTPRSKQLASCWSQPVQQLAQVANTVSDEMQERHRIYAALVMALIAQYWNGNNRGRDGTYHYGKRRGPYETYIGHNIAAIAVSGRGEVIAFDFNHNEIFNSSAEHAEARLMRRLFSLASSYDTTVLTLPRVTVGGVSAAVMNWLAEIGEEMSSRIRSRRSHYGTALTDVTVYTSLESCAQCSGIMALGHIKEVIYLEEDPDQHCIGNILFNLMAKEYPAPRPIPGLHIRLREFGLLNRAFIAFQGRGKDRPYFTSKGGTKDDARSITAFLCTDRARRIFAIGGKTLSSMTCKFPSWRPKGNALSNSEALQHAKNYFRYAKHLGRRGTPHK